jgi:putative RecB family exonuclease
LVTAYLEQNPVPVNEAVEGVEVRLEMQLPERPTTLVGIVDLIRGGSGSILVEYKTAAQTTNPKLLGIKHQTQLTAYSLLFEDAVGHEPAELQIHSVIKVKSPHVTTTRLPASNQRQKDQFFRAVDSWANGVSEGDWVASPGLQCAGCPYFARCLEHGGHQ